MPQNTPRVLRCKPRKFMMRPGRVVGGLQPLDPSGLEGGGFAEITNPVSSGISLGHFQSGTRHRAHRRLELTLEVLQIVGISQAVAPRRWLPVRPPEVFIQAVRCPAALTIRAIRSSAGRSGCSCG